MIGSVTRIERNEHVLAVPGTVAPATEDALSHPLFALKHEGVNMQVQVQVLALRTLRRCSTGAHLRPRRTAHATRAGRGFNGQLTYRSGAEERRGTESKSKDLTSSAQLCVLCASQEKPFHNAETGQGERSFFRRHPA